MSLCIRKISNKLTPYVGTRKPITQLDRQLPKHVKESSAFLLESLAPSVPINGRLNNARERASFPDIIIKPAPPSENIAAWNYKLKKESNCNIVKTRTQAVENVGKTLTNGVYSNDACKTVYMIGERGNALNLETRSNEQPQEKSNDDHGRPSQEQLAAVQEVLSRELPAFFVRTMDFSMYHPMIVFENNFKGTVTKGIHEYIKLAAMLRIITHFKYACVRLEILKITAHPEDSSVKVRWRIRGVPAYKFLMRLLRYSKWSFTGNLDGAESWVDGFSTYYVDGNGKVTRHVADKMMPDHDNEFSTKDKTGIAAKLALCVGVLAPPDLLAKVP